MNMILSGLLIAGIGLIMFLAGASLGRRFDTVQTINRCLHQPLNRDFVDRVKAYLPHPKQIILYLRRPKRLVLYLRRYDIFFTLASFGESVIIAGAVMVAIGIFQTTPG